MEAIITYKDLGLIIVFVVAVIAGLFLIRALRQLGCVLKKINRLIGENSDNFDKTAKALPILAENVLAITGEVQEISEKLSNEQDMIDGTLRNIGDTVGLITDTVQAVNDDVFSGVRKIAGLLAAIFRLVTKKGPEAGSNCESAPTAGAGLGSQSGTDAGSQSGTDAGSQPGARADASGGDMGHGGAKATDAKTAGRGKPRAGDAGIRGVNASVRRRKKLKKASKFKSQAERPDKRIK
jgi:DNA-binding transcriptional MerR regulator